MSSDSQPSPELVFNTLTAYQRTAALKAAIDLDLFSAISNGSVTAADLANTCQAAVRGIRILCDYLTIQGFLEKSGNSYSLTLDSNVFLNRNSPAYSGGMADFLVSPHLISAFASLTDSVRQGGSVLPNQGSTSPDHPMWITFAESMGGMMRPAAAGLAEILPLDPSRPVKVLDISASHGIWGIAFAQKNPNAQLVALDWAPVLEVAKRNAAAAGLGDRFSTIAGSAFDAPLGSNYDVILVPNFLHHFSAPDCTAFLKRCHAGLRPGGRVAIVEFVPNPDRVAPPPAASFSLVMLASTPEGDAYTQVEFAAMLRDAGFGEPEFHALPDSMNVALIAAKG